MSKDPSDKDSPPNPQRTDTQSQPSGRPAANQQSQKSQIAQYFRSQGKQPDDVILEMGGMTLRLKDLDG